MSKIKSEKITGHPSGASWFCLDHAGRTIELKQLFNVDAIKLIKQELQGDYST